jgi:hypothetical protein
MANPAVPFEGAAAQSAIVGSRGDAPPAVMAGRPPHEPVPSPPACRPAGQ